MPLFLWAFTSFASGWALCSLLFLLFTTEEGCIGFRPFLLISKDDTVLLKVEEVKEADQTAVYPPLFLKIIVMVIVVGCGILLLSIAIAQDNVAKWGFRWEEKVKERWFLTVLSIFSGFITRAYRSIISQKAANIYKGAFGEGSPSILLQAAVALSLLIGVILVLDPNLIDRITSIKAGEVEASFVEDTSKVRANVNLINLKRSVTLRAWKDFEVDEKWREASFHLAHEDMDRISFAKSLFYRQLRGLFSLGYCYQSLGELDRLKDREDIRSFIFDYAALVKVTSNIKHNSGESFDKETKQEMYKLYRASLKIQWALFFNLVNRPEIPPCLYQYKVFKEDPDTFKQIFLQKDLSQFWEPYTVSAVSDFVGFIDGDEHKAEFLDDFVLTDTGKSGPCSRDCGSYKSISEISFYWFLIRAKIDSDDLWPTGKLVDELAALISWVDKYNYTDESEMAAELFHAQIKDIEVNDITQLKLHFRRIILQDLSLGLELFYRKALAGEKISLLHQVYWRRWLDEVCQILGATEDVASTAGMSEKEIASWKQAKTTIEESPDNSALFDASTSAALSAILLPQLTGKPSASDCLLARSLTAYAKVIGPQLAETVSDGSHAAKANVEGFTEEIQAHVDDACR